MSSILLHMAWP